MPRSRASHACSALRGWLIADEPPCPENADHARSLAEAALEQGLGGALWEALQGRLHAWPARALARLRRTHRTAFVKGCAQLAVAGRVQRLLLDAGIRSVPLKGAALAEDVYGAPALRPMVDVDLLVLDDFRGAVLTTEAAGFRLAEKADHAWAFLDPSRATTLELHHAFTSCAGFFPVNPDSVWSRRRESAGVVRFLPGQADILVHLSLHAAFQHAFVLTLGQWLDFRRLLEAAPPELDALAEAAISTRAEGALGASLEVAALLTGAPVPLSWGKRFTPRIGPALRRWLDRKRADPLAFIPPVRPETLGARWALAERRRMELVRRTLVLETPGGHASLPVRAGQALARSARLAARQVSLRLTRR